MINDSVITNLERGQTIELKGYIFNKKILDKLSMNLKEADRIFDDYECKRLIIDYAKYYHKDNKKANIHKYGNFIALAFALGFSIGVFIAGIIRILNLFV